MKEARITITLSEYEGFKRTIQKKDEYIAQCVNNGKIKRHDIDRTIFCKHMGLGHMGLGHYNFNRQIRLLSEDYTEYLTVSDAEKINSIESRKAITEILKYKKEWESDYKEKIKDIKDYQNIIDDIGNKTWIDRLVYLFTGLL
jgi:DNA-directed RNA polymerase subunit N (RpoN/RPB10)